MALVWAEPFEQYGGTLALLSNAGYSAIPGALVNGQGRTGAYAYQAAVTGDLIRPLDAAATTLGIGVAMRPAVSMTRNDWNANGPKFMSAGSVKEITVVTMPDNSLGVYDRTATLKGKTAPNSLIGGTYTWVEAKAIGNVGGVINTGSVEVRLNGQTAVTVNGLNLPNIFSLFGIGGFDGQTYFDDLIVWDTTGANNTDFMGDRRLLISYPNANLALQDFVPSSGSAFDRVNDAPPVDTSYIEGAAAGNISEFSKDAISIASTDIAAVVIMGRLFKTDAGVASGRLGINSNGTVLNSPEIFPGTTGAFYRNIVERDPNGGIPWSRAAADAAAIRLTRQQ